MTVLRALTLSLAAVYLTVGCRSQGNSPVTAEADKLTPSPATSSSGQTPPAEADPEDGDSASDGGGAPLTGPKLMGYQYFVRAQYSLLNGTYSDKQQNNTTNRKSSLDKVKIPGKRYTLEYYPILVEKFPKSTYGYVILEWRDEKPKPEFWTKRQTAVALIGMVWPTNRIIAPVFGVHWEFNEISLSQDDSPEVAKSDLRAYIIGVHFRQKIWGTGTWFGAYHTGRLHLLNFTFANSGYEYEWGLGTTFQFGFFRSEFQMSYSGQTYKGNRQASSEEPGRLRVSSDNRTIITTVVLWI